MVLKMFDGSAWMFHFYLYQKTFTAPNSSLLFLQKSLTFKLLNHILFNLFFIFLTVYPQKQPGYAYGYAYPTPYAYAQSTQYPYNY